MPRPTKKRRPHTRTIDEELERTINKVSALSIGASSAVRLLIGYRKRR
jgi:hypothetical protein